MAGDPMRAGLHVVMLASVPFPPAEGLGNHVLSLARRLAIAGHRVTILTRGGLRESVLLREKGVVALGLPFVPAYPLHVHLHAPFVRRALARLGPIDLVHAHSPLPPDPGPLPAPLVTTLHSALRRDAALTPAADRHAVLTRLQTPISGRTEAALIRRSRTVAVVDPETIGYVRAIDPEASVEAVGNAVDVETIEPGSDERDPVVLFVGRLSPAKGLEDLLDAWPAIAGAAPGTRLEIIGDGPLRPDLERRAVRLGVAGSVRFRGVLGRDRRGDLVAAYRSAMAVVQPSHHEGLSTVILEAMAAATPVVATNVGAHRLVIDSGRDGLLIEPGRPADIGAAVVSLLREPGQAREMGRRGREAVTARFSWTSLAATYERIYRSALAEGPRR